MHALLTATHNDDKLVPTERQINFPLLLGPADRFSFEFVLQMCMFSNDFHVAL